MRTANVCHTSRPNSQSLKSGDARWAGSAFFVTLLALMVSSQAAFAAGRVIPGAIRGEKALVAEDATAHFLCEKRAFNSTRVACYGPEAMRAAYGLKSLLAAGIDGKGQTIVIIDAFGSPTVAEDLAAFDTIFGVPAPPSITQFHMPGSTPFDFNDANQLGWAEETSLDVQWSHAIAPGAKIIVIAAVDNSDAAILDAQNYAIDHRLGFIISESFGESEFALLQDGAAGLKILADDEKSYRRARRHRISVLVSAGDSGTAGGDINGNLVPFPVAGYPASSPNVTTIGGTSLFFGTATNADPNGTYQGEVVWNDGFGAGGGGVSMHFVVPDYQEDGLPVATRRALNGFRGYPDVAYNAGVRTGVIVYLGFLGPAFNGFYVFGGTSAGAPQWAGITAIANQLAKRPLGFLNTRLYRLGRQGILKIVMHDITVGNNAFDGIPGFAATLNWDLATGWGTPNDGLVVSLIGDEDGNDHDHDNDNEHADDEFQMTHDDDGGDSRF